MPKKQEAIMWLGTEESYQQYLDAKHKMENTDQETIKAMEAKMFPSDKEREYESPLIEVTDGIAVITIAGPLTNDNSFWSLLFGMTPYATVYDAVIEAALSDSVDSILLSIDSNGGTVAGISHALEGIREAGQIKPIYTHTASSMNSAAYWIGSAATEVMADRMAEVGSIGVIAMLVEYTKSMEKDGVTPHVFRAGKFKALGNPYEEFSDVVVKEVQGKLDARYEQFLEDVAINRGVTKDTVREKMAEGRTFLAKDAESVGLIDKVVSFNDAFRFVKAESTQSDSDRLHGNRGFGAEASNTELPIQSHEGENMPKKKVMTKEAQAAIAEGVDPKVALNSMGAEVDESAEGANDDQANTAVEGDVKPEAEAGAAEEGGGEQDASEQGAAEGIMALANKVGELSQSLAEANSELTTLKAKVEVSESTTARLKQIACDSITRMSIAMSMSVQDLSSMSSENLLALHDTTRVEFNNRLPVGQHIEAVGEEDEKVTAAVVSMNNRLASLTK